MRLTRSSLAAVGVAVVLCGCSPLPQDRDVLFQTSTITALLEGIYDGEMSCEELTKHGDLGIGTFDGLDGEMVVLDGKVYQIRADGKAYSPPDSLRTPFAAVTFFEPDKTLLLDSFRDYNELQQRLDTFLPTQNIPCALKIHGIFDYVKTRSVPKQSKPYPRLVEVVNHQPIFEMRETPGTIVGFRLPSYMDGINVPGYHLHFITEDRKAGGHVLDCSAHNVAVAIDYTRALFMVLPEQDAFYRADVRKREEGELEKVEK